MKSPSSSLLSSSSWSSLFIALGIVFVFLVVMEGAVKPPTIEVISSSEQQDHNDNSNRQQQQDEIFDSAEFFSEPKRLLQSGTSPAPETRRAKDVSSMTTTTSSPSPKIQIQQNSNSQKNQHRFRILTIGDSNTKGSLIPGVRPASGVNYPDVIAGRTPPFPLLWNSPIIIKNMGIPTKSCQLNHSSVILNVTMFKEYFEDTFIEDEEERFDVVTIMLGTNDARTTHFTGDTNDMKICMKNLVDLVRRDKLKRNIVNSEYHIPRIIFLTPPPMTAGIATEKSFGSPALLKSKIVPAIREFYEEERKKQRRSTNTINNVLHHQFANDDTKSNVNDTSSSSIEIANNYFVQMIDVFKIMDRETNAIGQNLNIFPDGMHLSRKGSQRIARLIVTALKSKSLDVVDLD